MTFICFIFSDTLIFIFYFQIVATLLSFLHLHSFLQNPSFPFFPSHASLPSPLPPHTHSSALINTYTHLPPHFRPPLPSVTHTLPSFLPPLSQCLRIARLEVLSAVNTCEDLLYTWRQKVAGKSQAFRLPLPRCTILSIHSNFCQS